MRDIIVVSGSNSASIALLFALVCAIGGFCLAASFLFPLFGSPNGIKKRRKRRCDVLAQKKNKTNKMEMKKEKKVKRKEKKWENRSRKIDLLKWR